MVSNIILHTVYFGNDFTKLSQTRSGFFHDVSELKRMRTFSDISGKGMVSLQYVFSCASLDDFYN